jgi:IS5 family transposase
MEVMRKGKAWKPTEFGKLVRIQEAEAQFITDYTVCETRVPDRSSPVPLAHRHRRRGPSPTRVVAQPRRTFISATT